jgi:hypothetical protein
MRQSNLAWARALDGRLSVQVTMPVRHGSVRVWVTVDPTCGEYDDVLDAAACNWEGREIEPAALAEMVECDGWTDAEEREIGAQVRAVVADVMREWAEHARDQRDREETQWAHRAGKV